MLPSVDSLLACRVILLLISTARPVSVLRWMVLRSFLPPASGVGKERNGNLYSVVSVAKDIVHSGRVAWQDSAGEVCSL